MERCANTLRQRIENQPPIAAQTIARTTVDV
jgi:hypothetical protein